MRFLSLIIIALVALPQAAFAFAEPAPGFGVYGWGRSFSGDVSARGRSAHVDNSYSDYLNHLDFGANGRLRIVHGPFSFAAEVLFSALRSSRDQSAQNAEVYVDQWIVEPTFGYRLFNGFETVAGVRYNRLDTKVNLFGVIDESASQNVDWWDPIVGGRYEAPLGDHFAFSFRGDVGGFGLGSDFTWQAEPLLKWIVSDGTLSLEAGYRWLGVDYEDDGFKFDTLTQGPELGLTLMFGGTA